MRLAMRPLASITVFGLALCAQVATAAPSLQTITDVWGGSGNGSIAAGCTTYAPIPELRDFFGGGGFVVQGGNAACGYTGVTSNLTQASGPMFTSQTLPPVPLDDVGGSYGGAASARASYGSLGVAASGVFSGVTGPTSAVQSTAAAFFRDTLDATSPSVAAGSVGFVRYVFEVDGSLSTLGTRTGAAALKLNLQHATAPNLDIGTLRAQGIDPGGYSAIDGDSSSWTFGAGSVSGSGLFGSTLHTFSGDLDQQFIWGTPWELQVGLEAIISRNADASFLASARLVDVQLFDAAHQLVSAFSLSSASGTDYLAAAAVPEPQTWALLVLGLATLGWRRRVHRTGRRASPDPLAQLGEQP